MTSWLIRLIPFTLILLGLYIASGQFPLEVPRPGPAGGVLLGAGLAIYFVESLFTGELTLEQEDASHTYRGLAARLWALLMMAVGGLLALAAGIEWLFPDSVIRWVQTPAGLGVALLIGGLLVTLWSIIEFIGPVRPNRSFWQQLSRLPRWIFFTVTFLLGLAAIGLGIIQLIMPEVTAAWYNALLAALQLPE